MFKRSKEHLPEIKTKQLFELSNESAKKVNGGDTSSSGSKTIFPKTFWQRAGR